MISTSAIVVFFLGFLLGGFLGTILGFSKKAGGCLVWVIVGLVILVVIEAGLNGLGTCLGSCVRGAAAHSSLTLGLVIGAIAALSMVGRRRTRD